MVSVHHRCKRSSLQKDLAPSLHVWFRSSRRLRKPLKWLRPKRRNHSVTAPDDPKLKLGENENKSRGTPFAMPQNWPLRCILHRTSNKVTSDTSAFQTTYRKEPL